MAVYDDLLPPADLLALRSAMEKVQYRGVRRDTWAPVWRVGDGNPLRGPSTWLPERPQTDNPALRTFCDRVAPLFDEPEVRRLIGTRSAEWGVDLLLRIYTEWGLAAGSAFAVVESGGGDGPEDVALVGAAA